MMIQYLTMVEKAAHEQGLIFAPEHKEDNLFNIRKEDMNKHFHSLSFVDDMAFPIIAGNNTIVNKIASYVIILYTYAFIFQIKLNF